MPDRPTGWVVRVAQRRLIDQHHRDAARRRREAIVASWTTLPTEPEASGDDSLTLLFLCCHSSLAPSAAIPLTLRAVCGLTTREIAHALFLPEATIAQRISRAKAAITRSEEPFRRPPTDLIDDRLGLRLLTGALSRHSMGEYQLQAAIAAVHDQAPSFEATDWTQLRALYNQLAERSDSPLVRLNRSVAIAHTDGPEAALVDIDDLGISLADYHRFHATVGYLKDLAGEHEAARCAYGDAARLATNGLERRFLQGKAESRTGPRHGRTSRETEARND